MEIESKYKVDSHPVEKIERLGFTHAGHRHLIDTYYLIETNALGQRVSLRTREDPLNKKYSLDHHKVVTQTPATVTQEIEPALPDAENLHAMQELLAELGYRPVCVVDKIRDAWQKDGVEITCDDVKNLGLFVEIEIMGDPTPETLAKIEEIATNLGIDPDQKIENLGYPDLIMQTSG